jgi:molybdate transport repressor ModE-like protein
MALVDERKIELLLHIHESGPVTGYSIATSDEVGYSKGYIYDILSELEEEGMIEVSDRETEGRKRVEYVLTENGLLLLRALDEINT